MADDERLARLLVAAKDAVRTMRQVADDWEDAGFMGDYYGKTVRELEEAAAAFDAKTVEADGQARLMAELKQEMEIQAAVANMYNFSKEGRRDLVDFLNGLLFDKP